MAKTASLKTIALRALKDPKTGAATRLVALRAAKPYLDAEDYEHRLRQLAEMARGKVLRLLLVELTEIDVASRADTAAKEKRAEIDRVLAEAARELALADSATDKPPTIQEDPNAKPIVVPEQFLEPHPALPTAPQNGVLSAGATAKELEEERVAALKRGRELATAIGVQLERCYLVPFNQQEAEKLDRLQAAFVAWEKQTHVQFPEIDTRKQFPDARLRPAPSRITDERSYRIKRRTMTWEEQRALSQERPTPTHEDSGFWGGIPRAC